MNPFIYGRVVRGEDFFDRKKECSHIMKTLMGGNNMVLYAPRRFGKTSLIFQVMEKLEKQNCVCIYFDFMPVYSVEAFVRLYAKALAVKQTNLNKFVRIFASLIKNIRPVLSFGAEGEPEFSVDFSNTVIDETIVAQLLDMPESLSGHGKRVIVFFDEFQEVEKLRGINFENLLRSKIQHQTKTNYLFFGSKTHLMNELFNDKTRAFYNSAAQMTIGPLPESDTIAYLQKKFSAHEITLDTEMARYLIVAAGNIPHYIQLLASEIWQYAVGTVTIITNEIVDCCAKRVLTLKSDYYMELFDRQSQSRKKLLQSLTMCGKNIFSAAYIAKYRLTSAATVQRATKELIADGTIKKLDGEYFIADPFFRLFMRET